MNFGIQQHSLYSITHLPSIERHVPLVAIRDDDAVPLGNTAQADEYSDTESETELETDHPYTKRKQGIQKQNTLMRKVNALTEEKSFKCDAKGCIAAFTQKCNLTSHMRTHTGEKPFKCDVKDCTAEFTAKSSLTNHMRTHTGEKPFKCNVKDCTAAFAQKSNLTGHMRTHK